MIFGGRDNSKFVNKALNRNEYKTYSFEFIVREIRALIIPRTL